VWNIITSQLEFLDKYIKNITKNAWTEMEAASFMESEPSSEKIFLLKIKNVTKISESKLPDPKNFWNNKFSGYKWKKMAFWLLDLNYILHNRQNQWGYGMLKNKFYFNL
jgi:hypothetical protein